MTLYTVQCNRVLITQYTIMLLITRDNGMFKAQPIESGAAQYFHGSEAMRSHGVMQSPTTAQLKPITH
jgi:hypothetical protein